MPKTKYRIIETIIIIGILISVLCGVLSHIGRTFAFNDNTINDITTVSIGELLIEDYDAGIEKPKVFHDETFWALIDALRGKGEEDTKIANLSNKDAQAIRDANDGKDIIVTIDGKRWTVTDLRKLDNGQVIATMWLATSAEMSQWNPWYANTPTDAYPSNMYSTSYIRADALNSGGSGYVATQGATTLTQVAQSADHQYAKFTMPSVKDGSRETSLLDYIVQPKDVAYQGTETIVKYNSSYKTCPNEAWGTPEIESYYNANMNYSNKTHYTEWASDYLWLPSLAETGYSGVAGIWNLSNEQRSNGTNSWLRSGYYSLAHRAYVLTASGGDSNAFPTNTAAVRPAFHFNLTSAALSAASLGIAPPTDFSVEYNGAEQSIAAADWYKSAVHGNAATMSVRYSPATVCDAGEYTVEMTLVDPGQNWKDETSETDRTRTVKMTITPHPIALKNLTLDAAGVPVQPELLNGTSDLYDRDVGKATAPQLGLRYTGTTGTGQAYDSTDFPTVRGNYKATAYIVNADSCNYKLDKTYSVDFVKLKEKVTVPWMRAEQAPVYDGTDKTFTLNDYADGGAVKIVSCDGMTRTGADFVARRAGTYEIVLGLVDPDATEWNDTTSGTGVRTVTVKIDPKTLSVSASSSTGAWQIPYGTQATLEMALSGVESGDTVSIKGFYYETGAPAQRTPIGELSSNGTLSAQTGGTLAQGNYAMMLEFGANGADNSNYKLPESGLPQLFAIVAKQIECNEVFWQYYNNGQYILVSGDHSTADKALEVTYNTYSYAFTIQTDKLPAGVTLSGYTAQDGTVAGTYVTSVRVSAGEGNEFADGSKEKTFQLHWKIAKAKYDLSGAKWNYTSLTYNESYQTVEMIGLPAGLTAQYAGNRELDASADGAHYTARVTGFAGVDTDNYIVPNQTDADSYQGDFAWTLEWRIERVKIELTWKDDEHTDGEGQVYWLPVLTAYWDKVDKVYYRSDRDQTKGEALGSADEIVLDPNNETYYLVEVTVKANAAANYELSGTDNPHWFRIGQNKQPVEVAITGSGLPYDGTPHEAGLIISTSLSEDNFTKTYFLGETRLDGAPTDAGTYRLVVTFRQGVDDYYIDGDSEFEFVIARARIDLSGAQWDYAQAYEYGLDGGTPIVYTVALSGVDALPQNMREMLERSYSGHQGSQVNAYRATVSLDFSAAEGYDNYEIILPSAAGADKTMTLSWSIRARTLSLPQDNGTWTVFDDIEHDLVGGCCGMPSGWNNYLDVQIVYKLGDINETLEGTTARNAGTYVLTYTIKSAINPDPDNPNVEWADGDVDGSKRVTITIAPRTLTIVQWTGTGMNARVQFEQTDVPNGYYAYRYLDESGQEVDRDYVRAHAGEKFYREAIVAADYAGNIVLEYADGVAQRWTFVSGSDDPIPVEVPTVVLPEGGLIYDGAAVNVTELLQGFDPATMEIAGDLSGTNAGTYTVTITPKAGAEWATPPAGGPSAPITLTYTIAPAPLQGVWETADGKPVLSIPPEYTDVTVEYEYRDAAGNVVSADALQAGQTYTVIAKLSGTSAGNYVFVAENGQVTETPTQSDPNSFTFGSDGNPDDPNNPNNPDGTGSGGAFSPKAEKIIVILMIAMTSLLGGIFVVLLLMWFVQMDIRRIHNARNRRETK